MYYEEKGINSALVIVMSNGRYFKGFDKAGSASTAWSLAGSTLFLNENDKSFTKAIKRLTDKGSKFEVKSVQLVDHSFKMLTMDYENLSAFFSDPLRGCTKDVFEGFIPKVQKEKFREWVTFTYGTDGGYKEVPMVKIETQENLENYLDEL